MGPPLARELSGRQQRHEVPRPLGLLVTGEGELRTGNDAVEGIVVGRGDGVILVVVAAGTANGEAKGRLAERVDRVLMGQVHVIDRVEAEPSRDGEKAGRRDPFGEGFSVSGIGQQVAGKLFPQELVVRLVGIERSDHVIAVLPGLRRGVVARFASGVGVPHQIEPVPPPPLAIGRLSQQPIDHPGKRVGRGVRDERIEVGRLRRQTSQVIGNPPQKRRLAGWRNVIDARLGQPRADEGVDRMDRGRNRSADARYRRVHRHLIGPVLSLLCRRLATAGRPRPGADGGTGPDRS